MSHGGRRLAWSSDSVSMSQRTNCIKGKVVSLLCDRLWISLLSLSRGMMNLREVHRSLIFCPDFHVSSAAGIRSRDIWKFWFYICNHVIVWTVTCKSGTHVHSVCSGKPVGRRGSVLGWLCAPGDHVTKGDAERQCPWGPGAPRGSCKSHPCSWHISAEHISVLNISEAQRQNVMLSLPNVWLLCLDPQRRAEL